MLRFVSKYFITAVLLLHDSEFVVQLIFGPDCNPLTPVHKFLYVILQVEGPENPNKYLHKYISRSA
jgi:hypothetical protein